MRTMPRAAVIVLLLMFALAAGDFAAMLLADGPPAPAAQQKLTATAGQAPGTAGQQLPTLKDTLEKGLKCRRPLEFNFVDKVADLVEQDVLPYELVLSTFQYARVKKPYPFPYFRQALRIRVAAAGIDVDL